jgi:hypothetical protein
MGLPSAGLNLFRHIPIGPKPHRLALGRVVRGNLKQLRLKVPPRGIVLIVADPAMRGPVIDPHRLGHTPTLA